MLDLVMLLLILLQLFYVVLAHFVDIINVEELKSNEIYLIYIYIIWKLVSGQLYLPSYLVLLALFWKYDNLLQFKLFTTVSLSD